MVDIMDIIKLYSNPVWHVRINNIIGFLDLVIARKYCTNISILFVSFKLQRTITM